MPSQTRQAHLDCMLRQAEPMSGTVLLTWG